MDVQELMSAIRLLNSLENKPQSSKRIDGGIRIVVLQRGWVCVGKYSRKGTECTLEDASVVRRWGTTDGLPQLAENGPFPETKLEKSKTTIRFHRSAEVLTIDCNRAKWEK